MLNTTTNVSNLTSKITRISWGAIIAGALTSLVLVFLLNLLGLGIGLSAVDPFTESDPLKGIGTGAMIWLGLSNIIALIAGGMVAGRMSGFLSKADGGLHGFISWALYAMVSLYLITSTVGSVIGGVGSTVSGIFGGGKSNQTITLVNDADKKGQDDVNFSLDNIKEEAFNLINKGEQIGVISGETSDKAKSTVNEAESDTEKTFKKLDLDENVDKFFNELSFDLDNNGNLKVTVEGNKDFINKAELKQYLVDNTELSNAEIDGLINKWDTKIKTAVAKSEKYYATAKKKALKYSEKASDAVGKASIIAFFVLILGAMAAFFGGTLGSPEHTVGTENLLDENNK